MEIINSAELIRSRIEELKHRNLSIGFVPTMGALHKGHLSLIEAAGRQCDIVVCSIFVNPTQFNEKQDFDNYPRTLDKDIALLESSACKMVFAPSVEVVYPEPDTTQYNLGPIMNKFEGAFRPGHFNGMASVVKRLLEIIEPDRAYFGKKDYQQYLLVKNLVSIYNLKTEIVGCDIVREESGLAMSSRNKLLSNEEKQIATVLSRILKEARAELIKTTEPAVASEIARKKLTQEKGVEVEYFDIVDSTTLEYPQPHSTQPLIALVAARVGKVRLIDNLEMSVHPVMD